MHQFLKKNYFLILNFIPLTKRKSIHYTLSHKKGSCMKICAYIQYYGFLVVVFLPSLLYPQKPSLIIMSVIDQLSYTTLVQLKPYLRGGLRTMLDNGMVYEHAQWPHGMPGTGPGHTSLSTGALPKDHGIIDNAWLNSEGVRVVCDQDSPEKAAVFTPDGISSIGKSPHFIMVDTLSDQLKLSSTPLQRHKAFSISLKSRSSITMAGSGAQALWFDPNNGIFTSSTAYFSALPTWVTTYTPPALAQGLKKWSLQYPADAAAYQWANPETYVYTQNPSLINTVIDCSDPKALLKSPFAHDVLLDFGLRTLHSEFKDNNGTFLLWLGFSSLDKIGHAYGPNSLEYIDMLYALDKQLDRFMKLVAQLNPPEKTLYVVTADHGSMPIPELAHTAVSLAQRINITTLQKTINDAVEEKFGLSNFIVYTDTPSIYCDRVLIKNIPQKQLKKIFSTIKHVIRQQPGMKNVWTTDELLHGSYHKHDVRWLYQNQLYHGRSGNFIFQVVPYAYPSNFNYGTGHRTPYYYDRHVPIIFYQPGTIKAQSIAKPVYGQQIAPTIAHMLGIPRPSASAFALLPGFVTTKTPKKLLQKKVIN